MTKVFITGATGFIGGRLAEVACSRQIAVVALVRTWSRAARLARLPAQMVPGNVLDMPSISRAMAGCDVVFHCAVDNRSIGREHQTASIQGTRNVLETARAAGVRRVVHLSSAAVFSYRSEGAEIDEASPYRYTRDWYCSGKIGAEKVAIRYFSGGGVPVTILRPTIVYGPFGDYSRETARLLREGRMVLIDGGKGLCNCVYVDDLVDAMLLAADSSTAVGEIFHISGTEPVFWSDFVGGHADALEGIKRPIPDKSRREVESRIRLSESKLVSSYRQAMWIARDPRTHRVLLRIPIIRDGARLAKRASALLLSQPSHARLWDRFSQEPSANGRRTHGDAQLPKPLTRGELNMVTAFEKTRFSIKKARQILGYDPRVDFKEGMKRTAAWIKWARL